MCLCCNKGCIKKKKKKKKKNLYPDIRITVSMYWNAHFNTTGPLLKIDKTAPLSLLRP